MRTSGWSGSSPDPLSPLPFLPTIADKPTAFFKKFIYLIYFLAALGLRCCAWAFSSCSERGLLFVVVHRLLIAVASLVAEHGR